MKEFWVTKHGKRLLRVTLALCVVIIFVIAFNGLSASSGDTYFYVSRIGWEWGMWVDYDIGSNGQMREIGKSFCVGPFVIAHSHNLGIGLNSASSKANSTPQP
jgi:hypothetical protein